MARLTGLRRLCFAAGLRRTLFAGLMVGRLYCGSLEGRVADSVSGTGITGAEVALVPSAQNNPPMVTTTDGTGGFRFSEIADGPYAAVASKESYVRVLQQPLDLNVVAVSGATHLDLKMTRLAKLYGRVVDADEKPIPGITIKVLQNDDPNSAATAVTGEKGEFHTGGLRAGTYALVAEVKLDRETPDGERMVTTFYPSVADSGQAVPVTVGSADMTGLDIQMRTAAVRKIRGTVLDIDGDPAAQTIVGLLKPGIGTRHAIDLEQVLTDDEGKFEFTPVTPGEYRVQADNSLDYDYQAHHPLTRSAAQRVVVSDRPLDPIEIRLAPPFALDVAVEWRDGDQRVPVHPNVIIDVGNLDLQPGVLSRSEQEIDGLFPGRYLINAPDPKYLRGDPSSTAKYYLASVRLNGREVLGQAAELSGPATVQVMYRSGAGSVRGRASGCSGRMVSATSESGRGFWSICDSSGAFAIGNLPPGEYTVSLANAVERVKVDAGAVVTVELK